MEFIQRELGDQGFGQSQAETERNEVETFLFNTHFPDNLCITPDLFAEDELQYTIVAELIVQRRIQVQGFVGDSIRIHWSDIPGILKLNGIRHAIEQLALHIFLLGAKIARPLMIEDLKLVDKHYGLPRLRFILPNVVSSETKELDRFRDATNILLKQAFSIVECSQSPPGESASSELNLQDMQVIKAIADKNLPKCGGGRVSHPVDLVIKNEVTRCSGQLMSRGTEIECDENSVIKGTITGIETDTKTFFTLRKTSGGKLHIFFDRELDNWIEIRDLVGTSIVIEFQMRKVMINKGGRVHWICSYHQPFVIVQSSLI